MPSKIAADRWPKCVDGAAEIDRQLGHGRDSTHSKAARLAVLSSELGEEGRMHGSENSCC